MRKTIIIDGIEYELTPVIKKEEPKNTALFVLSMPKVGSWNGKWTGSERFYAVSRKIMNRGKCIYPNFKPEEGNYHYDFGDGWCASIHVSIVTAKEAKEAVHKSEGKFCGYEWMVESILRNGEIKTSTQD